MIDRKPQILDVASELLQTRSFTSFSYQDLSDRLGISKASVHHHFASKEDLLLALTARYRAGQRRMLEDLDRNHARPTERLEAYLAWMTQLASSGTKICPMGALQSEYNVIPEAVRADIQELFDYGKRWLSGVLTEGRERGEMEFEGSPTERAVFIMASLQGALQISRAAGPKEFTAVTSQIKLALKPRARK
jgi:TetR/AcrR family transcriptional repressor of nem operon